MACTITVDEFKTQFDRGPFTYGATLPDVRDKDITAAIAEATAVFNDIYPDETTCKLAFSYLTAHFLTLDVDASNSGGQAAFIQTSRSADGISESLQVPQWMQEGVFSLYAVTYYGQKYLMLSRPYLGGVVLSVPGSTSP